MGGVKLISFLGIGSLFFLFAVGVNGAENKVSARAHFEFLHYTGQFESGNITIAPIIVNYDGVVSYALAGANSNLFGVTRTDNTTVILYLPAPIPQEIVSSTNYMVFTMNALTDGVIIDITVIHIYFSKRSTCTIDGVSDAQWSSQYNIDIVDTDRGITFERTTGGIVSITSIEYLKFELNRPPYLNFELTSNRLTISLNATTFAQYEENELSTAMTVSVTFACTNGARKLTFVHIIRDTNNNSPRFEPTSDFTYTLFTPIPANIPFTMLYGDIVVRDIDLSNRNIVPRIEQNDNFDLVYRAVDCNRKTHRLALVTKRPIVSLPSAVTLYIVASDNDTTGYPALSTIGSVTINPEAIANIRFEKPLYEGELDMLNVRVADIIRLTEPFSTNITISFAGEKAQHFSGTYNNSLSIIVTSLIPDDFVLNNDVLILTLTAAHPTRGSANTFLHLKLIKDPTCFVAGWETEWNTHHSFRVYDYFNSSNFFQFNIRDISGIVNVEHITEDLNEGPYADARLVLDANNVTVFRYNILSNFINYEIHETVDQMAMIVTFQCTRNTRKMKLISNIIDTNNHYPQFLPNANYQYVVAAPFPANYPISTIYGEIVVRDIDLTNTAIIPSVEVNDYVKLEYKANDCKKKDHKLILSSKQAIPPGFNMTFRITATDLDFTGDAPNRSFADVKITTK